MEHRTLKQRDHSHSGADKSLGMHYQNMKNLKQLVQTIEGILILLLKIFSRLFQWKEPLTRLGSPSTRSYYALFRDQATGSLYYPVIKLIIFAGRWDNPTDRLPAQRPQQKRHRSSSIVQLGIGLVLRQDPEQLLTFGFTCGRQTVKAILLCFLGYQISVLGYARR